MATNKKPRKKRYDKQGQLRIPPVAVAYFYDRGRRLCFVYPSPGEHPDFTIRRTCKIKNVPATPGHVTVTKMYWEIVKNLPSVMMDGKGENAKGEKVSIFSIESLKDLQSEEDKKNNDNVSSTQHGD